MIRSVWIKIALLLGLAIVPVMLLQLRMARESLELIFELTTKIPIRSTLDEHMELLKSTAALDAANESRYRSQFQGVVETKQGLDDFYILKESLIDNIRHQTIRNAAIILAVSLLLSLLVSARIVNEFKKLLEEKQRAAMERERLISLERWQDVARMLVHELKAPLTPIKLIATDIEQKFETMDATTFRSYLGTSQSLIRQQIDGLDTMVRSFTRFGKLPPPKYEPTAIRPFLDAFRSVYEVEFKDQAVLVCEDSLPPDFRWNLDPKLIRDVLYNLTKNAVEANAAQKIEVGIMAFKENRTLHLRVRNTGGTIPKDNEASIFEPYFSNKRSEQGTPNMGLGLSICRKIALDHGGSLELLYNDPRSGVVFECILAEKPVSEEQ